MKRSGWGGAKAAAAARGVLGTASHGQASTRGCHWLRSLSVRASTVHTRVIAAIPPVRSTLIFMAWPLGFHPDPEPMEGAPGQRLKFDLYSFPRRPYGVMLRGPGTEQVRGGTHRGTGENAEGCRRWQGTVGQGLVPDAARGLPRVAAQRVRHQVEGAVGDA